MQLPYITSHFLSKYTVSMYKYTYCKIKSNRFILIEIWHLRQNKIYFNVISIETCVFKLICNYTFVMIKLQCIITCTIIHELTLN